MRRFAIAVLFLAGLYVTAASQEVKTKPEMKDEKKEKPEFKDMTPDEIGGKSVEQWTKECSSRDPSKRENAIRTVLQFGPEKAYHAVPTLLAELKKHSKDSPIDLSVRVSGALAVGAILGHVKEPDPKYLKDAVAILRTFLKDNQAIVKYRALQALPLLGPESRAAIPEVIVLVRDPDTWETRQTAIQVLAVLAADSKSVPSQQVLQALYRAISDSSHNVRFAAVSAIGQLGAPGDASEKTGMVRQLELVASKDPDPGVQMWSHIALMTVKQSISKEHLLPIAKMLHHSEVNVRAQAASALGMAGPKGVDVAPQLVAALSDPDPGVVANSIVSLVRMEYTGAVPALHKLSEDPRQNEVMKKAAAQAMDAIQKGGKKDNTKKDPPKD